MATPNPISQDAADPPAAPVRYRTRTRLVTGRQVAALVGRVPHAPTAPGRSGPAADGVVPRPAAGAGAEEELRAATRADAPERSATSPTDGAAGTGGAEYPLATSVPAGRGPASTDGEAGMATAEYAIATVAAAGFAGLLVVLLRSGEVRELLFGIIRSALSL